MTAQTASKSVGSLQNGGVLKMNEKISCPGSQFLPYFCKNIGKQKMLLYEGKLQSLFWLKLLNGLKTINNVQKKTYFFL